MGNHLYPILIAIYSIIFLAHNSHAQQAYDYTQPTTINDNWPTQDMQALDVDMTKIQMFFSQLQKEKHQLDSIVLIKNGAIVLEEYFNQYSIDKNHDLRSVTKSIRSILLGIAIDKGIISSVDDPITKYLKKPVAKKNLDERKQRITIRHLATMSTGLACNDWDKKSKGQEDRVYKKKDWLQYTLNLPMANDPGAVAHYCSMGAILVAEIISQASGQSIIDFAEKHLFEPLGIGDVKWGHTRKKAVIDSGKRLYMSPRNLAKIGQLVLNKGQWNNKQIVSEKWIENMTTPHTKITNLDYGFMWWNIPFLVQEQWIKGQVATGNGGQYVMVFPEQNMVAVFTGSAYNSQEDKLPFAIVKKVFLPTFLGK